MGKAEPKITGRICQEDSCLGIFSVNPFFDRSSRRDGRLWHHSDGPLLLASFHDALCLDIVVPGVFRVPIDVIVIDGDLRDITYGVWGFLRHEHYALKSFIHARRADRYGQPCN
jgi:hypothetical protein